LVKNVKKHPTTTTTMTDLGIKTVPPLNDIWSLIAYRGIQNKNVDIVRLAVKNGANLKMHHNKQRNVFAIACEQGNLETVEFLVGYGKFDVKEDNNIAIIATAKRGHLGIFKYLWTQGADINARNNAPLYFAGQNLHWDIVEFIEEQTRIRDTQKGGDVVDILEDVFDNDTDDDDDENDTEETNNMDKSLVFNTPLKVVEYLKTPTPDEIESNKCFAFDNDTDGDGDGNGNGNDDTEETNMDKSLVFNTPLTRLIKSKHPFASTPKPISPELALFLGVSNDTLMTRVDVVKFITKYIQENSLTSNDKRIFTPDKKLETLFGTDLLPLNPHDPDSEKGYSYFNLLQYLVVNGHLPATNPCNVIKETGDYYMANKDAFIHRHCTHYPDTPEELKCNKDVAELERLEEYKQDDEEHKRRVVRDMYEKYSSYDDYTSDSDDPHY
jgi:chromatin remodeling complex protein RSC6